MDLVALYLQHPAWSWIGIGATLLVLEVGSASGYLLWPAASAGAVAVLAYFGLAPGWDFVIFAVLTIASTYAGRRWLKRPEHLAPDINDPSHRLTGRTGIAVVDFNHDHGRVFVDGKEWAAETEGEAELRQGDRIEVTRVLDGGRLKIRPTP